jgi:hypothetical protein
MNTINKPIRVLYSFPLRLGVDRICYIAWQQVNGLAAAGAEILAAPASLARPVPASVAVAPTLEWRNLRLPFRVVGTMRAVALHDRIVAGRLETLAGKIDLIHTWPLGALETLKKAAKLGIPTVLERPNAHTRFAMEVVQAECDRLGVALPPDHEHAFNREKVEREEAEYSLATRLLCPADFVVKTFLDRGFKKQQLVRHIYAYDDKTYYPAAPQRKSARGLTMLFVGVCAVRKGVHFALEAWLKSPASKDGRRISSRLPGKAGADVGASERHCTGTSERCAGTYAAERYAHLAQHRRRIRAGNRRSDGIGLRPAGFGGLYGDLPAHEDGAHPSCWGRGGSGAAHYDAARRPPTAEKAARRIDRSGQGCYMDRRRKSASRCVSPDTRRLSEKLPIWGNS